MKIHATDNTLFVSFVYRGGEEGIERLIVDLTQLAEDSNQWPDSEDHDSIRFGRAIEVSLENFVRRIEGEDDPDRFFVKLANRVDNYWVFDRNTLGIEFSLMIGVECNLKAKHFVAERNVSILPKMNSIVTDELIIGGDRTSSIPFDQYEDLIAKLPSSTEVQRYVAYRLAGVLSQYFEVKGDHQEQYEKILKKRLGTQVPPSIAGLDEAESQKFEFLHDELQAKLKEAEKYSEDSWQKQIILFIRCLYPQYVAVLEKVRITDPGGKRREIDLLLVDASGNVDVVEIKKPFDYCVMSKTTYRDNHVPLRELSGSIMQVEKYIQYLQRGGGALDRKIQEAHSSKIPEGIKVRVTNPRALVIIGRFENLSKAQRSDFEVVRRKYKNVMDIVTYDDLIDRFRAICKSFKVSSPEARL